MSSKPIPDTVTFNVSCHCRSISLPEPITLSKSHFPLKSALCYCNSCRHATGQLMNTFTVMPTHVKLPEEFKTKCTAYASSGTLTRYFCPTCGASVGNVEADEWEFTVGVLHVADGEGGGEGSVEGLLDRAMLWISDTKDGGAAVWLTEERWAGQRWMSGRVKGDSVTDEMVRAMAQSSVEERQGRRLAEELECQCHCGNIKLRIQRPESGGKWPAGLCACTSCRMTSGFEITSWAFLSRDCVKMGDGSDLDLNWPGLVHYQSSKSSHRYFCTCCGAKVFYSSEQRPETIDLSVGLVDPAHGARALSWSNWADDGEEVAFPEDAIDQGFVRSLIDGIRDTMKK